MTQTETKKKFTEHKIIIENRSAISITGVDKVETAIPTQFTCIAMGERLQILGEMLEVARLDVECGCVSLSGKISSINYIGEKKSLLRRLFK